MPLLDIHLSKMSKSAYTKFVLRTTKKIGVAPLYTRRVGFNSNLMLNSRIEVDIKTWNDAISTPGRWNTFRAGPGKELCDKLDEMSALIDSIIIDPKGSKAKLNKAIDDLAHREQREFQEAQRKALEEAKLKRKAEREAEQRRKKKNLKLCSVSVKNLSLWHLMRLLKLRLPEHGTANRLG